MYPGAVNGWTPGVHTVVYPINALKIGGAEQQLLELVRGLDKRQFRPIVAPLYPGGALDPEFRAVPGVEVVDLNRKGKYEASTLVHMAQLLHACAAEIVQPFLTPATFFGLVPALARRVPVTVATERCGVERFRSIGTRTYRVLEDLLSRAADAVVANSLAGRRLLLSRGIPASKIHVFYNGVNPARLQVDRSRTAAFRAQLGVPEGGKVVAVLASLSPAKDHMTFLRAAAQVSANHPQLRFAIIGDGPLRAQLEAFGAQLGLSERVHFLGFRRGVADLLAGCDLLVSSSRDNEGCSNSILEAMFLGVPVVATDVGGNSELIEHGITGYLCPMEQPHALAETIERRLLQPEETAMVAARARQRAPERFSVGRMVADYENLYQTLLTARRRGVAGQADRVHG